MYLHHAAVIQRLIEKFQPDPNFVAVIVGGSVAKGWAKENSDVDVMLVVTEDEYARRTAMNDLVYYDPSLCDYEGGYVDGKIMPPSFLQEVADHGSEPARAAFVNARVAYSHDPAIAELVARIPVYPEAERAEKLRAFYGQVLLLNWYVGEAEKRSDPYLLAYMSSDLALFASRLILAHNRMLYPYHKWLMKVVAQAPEKPAHFMEMINALVTQPTQANAQALCDSLSAFQDWGVTIGEAVILFMHHREWNWRTGRAPLQDW